MKKVIQLFTLIASVILFAACNNKTDASTAPTNSKEVKFLGVVEKQTDTARTNLAPAKKLILSFCQHPIKIVSGKNFSFPKNLKELGLEVQRNGDAYVLKGIVDAQTGGSNSSIIIGNGNTVSGNNITITQQGGKSTITVRGNNSGTIIQNGNTIIIGSGNNEPVLIMVPDGTDLDASLSDDLTVTAKIGVLDIDISGSADVSIESSESVGSVNISGSGNVIIKKTGTINNMHVSGSGDISVRQCTKVSKVSVSGSGEIDLPDGIEPQSVRISGSGDVH